MMKALSISLAAVLLAGCASLSPPTASRIPELQEQRDGLLLTVVEANQLAGEATHQVLPRLLENRTTRPTRDDWNANRVVLSESRLMQEILWLRQLYDESK